MPSWGAQGTADMDNYIQITQITCRLVSQAEPSGLIEGQKLDGSCFLAR